MNAVTLMQTPSGWYATPMGPWAAFGDKSGEKFAHRATPDATAISIIAAEAPRDVVIVVEGAGPAERALFPELRNA
jgi:hypothetical protein